MKMRALSVFALFFSLLGLVLSCKPVCPAGDLQCLFASLTIRDDASAPGPKLQLHPVATGSLSALIARDGSPDGGHNADGRFQVVVPSTLTHDGASDGTTLALVWTDPLGCRPAFCFTPCPHNARCLGQSLCTPLVRDGLTRGFSSHRVEYDKAPAEALDFELDVTPVSAQGCPEDITALLTAFSKDVLVGTPSGMQVHIPGSGGGGGGGGIGGDCLTASTLSCTPLGTSGVASTCISAVDFQQQTGLPLPAACAPQGTTDCLDTQRGLLVKPCCPGLTCRVGRACNGGSTFGGGCQP